MVNKYLDEAIGELKKLTAITNEDIENIRKADASELDEHTKQKDALISDFEATKKALDAELVKLAKENAGKNLGDLLSGETRAKLSELRAALQELKIANKQYAKSVIVVKDFYDALVSQMLGKPEGGEYSANARKARM